MKLLHDKTGENDLPLKLSIDKTVENDLQMKLLHDKSTFEKIPMLELPINWNSLLLQKSKNTDCRVITIQ